MSIYNKLELIVKYDYLYKIKGIEHKSARIYPEDHLDLCLKHAKEVNGKVRCRETNKIIYNFCKSKEKENVTKKD